MWKLVYGSVQGTSHVQSGQPCQDYCAGAITGTTLVVACADGAGSAEFSQLGSKATVDRFLEVASGETVPTSEQVKTWVEAARERLIEQATAIESTPRQLACTFLAALVGDGWVVFVQVGDGVIVFDGPDGYDLAFWPDNGEYANTTRFLSEDDYRQHLRIEITERKISELAVLTDGLQMLALDIAGAKVHDRFFAPLFKTVRNGPDEAALQVSLLDFMDSNRVNERTDDDKTLFLATRITADVSQNLSDAIA
ncbi:PP2C family serine/threonine-protein phosphatase [Planctomicrobium sp. SH668]|uniref:PP2C family serine/threonine-protein phosphatase n=1 Tax=Planctomicrobium sp. SH668 TaxID=3448126 RepID=UPI003F5B7AAB